MIQSRRKEIWRETGLNPDNYSLAVGQAMEQYAIEYHEQQVKNLNIPDVMKSVCPACGGSGKTPRLSGDIIVCYVCDGTGQTVL